MKTIASFKKGVVKARKLWQAEKHSQALAEVDRLLADWPQNPQLLVMRADLIRLQDRAEGVPGLDEAKENLELAATLDDESPAALIELGYFCYAIEDDAGKAAEHFQEAVGLARQLLKDALLGRAKALGELNRNTEALACLAEAYSLTSRNGKSGGDEILEQLWDLQKAD